MTSPARLEANRRNALRSTGPRTAAGKLASSRNATRHGLLTEQPLLTGEDPAQFDGLRERLVDALSPDGAVEELLVDDLLGVLWRLQRLRRVETALYMLGAPAPVQEALRLAGETQAELGVAFSSQAASFSVLTRYESTLINRARKAMSDLERHQSAREADDADFVVIARGGFVSQDRGA